MAEPAPSIVEGPWSGRRVVLVHDWLTGMRGGEKVLESLCRVLPHAELLTLVHKRGSVSPLISGRTIRTSPIQRLPQATERYRHYLPLFPTAIELFDLDDADLVVSTSHCAAKAVVPTGRARHLCYCHSPMRYAWDQFDAYFGPDRVGPVASALYRPIMAWLARWDAATAHRVHAFVANSGYVAGRIARYYNRPASVLHPPVDTGFFTPGTAQIEPYFLIVSALVPYKRIEVAIAAAHRLHAPLKIVGQGPDLDRLRTLAGPTVEFIGALPDDELREMYRRATAVLLPGEEDFGIVPVEAMACGRPVIALARGGAVETVRPGETGQLVAEPTPEAFAAAMDDIRRHPLDPAVARDRALTFGVDRFEAAIRTVLRDLEAQPTFVGGYSGQADRMLRRYNRLLVATHVVADFFAAATAFILAYLIRFESPITEFVPVTKGTPPLLRYAVIGSALGVLVVLAFHLQGLYRLRRGRTRVDDFFGVLVGSFVAGVFGLTGTLYIQAYHLSDALKAEGFLEISRTAWVLFLALNVLFTYTSREVVRDLLRRRWRAGIGLRRVLIVGAGDLGRMVADRMLEHSELGFRLVGFVDDRAAATDAIGYRGLPILGSIPQVPDICSQEQIDEIYVALPIEEHVKMLGVVEYASRECLNIHVVPDLLQFIALRARLEDLDGLPIIRINDVPLRGFNSVCKRAVDMAISLLVVVVGLIPGLIMALHHQAQLAGTGVLPAGAHGSRRPRLHRLQVPLDAGGRRRRQRPDLGARRRPARDADRALAPPPRRRRAAAVLERPPRRHVDRRAAAGTAVLRRAVQTSDSAVHAPAQGQGRDHRVGTGQWLARQYVPRKTHRVRPLLHRELVALARFQDHVAHAAPRLPPDCVTRESRHHRRRRLHRIPSLGDAARSRPLGRRDRQSAHRRHREHRAPHRA